jgi:hypothetical protein
MPASDWYVITSVSNSVLDIVVWGFPLILTTVLAYYIEKYTKFKTRWQFLAAGTLLALVHSAIIIYDYQTVGMSNPSHEVMGDTLLTLGMILGAYASLNLLQFQKISIGKTKDFVEIAATVGFIIPALAYLGERIPAYETWSLIAHNLSVTLLALIFLIIGKLIRNYVPRHGRMVYLLTAVASMLLSLNIPLRSYAFITVRPGEYQELLIMVGLLLQSAAAVLLALSAAMLIREAHIRGIHLTSAKTESRGDEPLRYRLKKGFSYILSDADGARGLDIFKDYVLHNNNGLGITRTKPDIIRDEHGLRTTPILWMTTAETEHKSVRPTDLERLLFIIKDFISNKGDIVFIERLDYLIAENGFRQALSFIHRLNDLVVSSDCILVVSMNFSTLPMEQRNQLMQEFKDLSGEDNMVLNESLYEVLNYVYLENQAGRRPSYKKVTDKFGITKTTTRRRIYELEVKKLLRVIDDGKFKLLEVTEAGRDVMKNPVGPKGW